MNSNWPGEHASGTTVGVVYGYSQCLKGQKGAVALGGRARAKSTAVPWQVTQAPSESHGPGQDL